MGVTRRAFVNYPRFYSAIDNGKVCLCTRSQGFMFNGNTMTCITSLAKNGYICEGGTRRINPNSSMDSQKKRQVHFSRADSEYLCLNFTEFEKMG